MQQEGCGTIYPFSATYILEAITLFRCTPISQQSTRAFNVLYSIEQNQQGSLRGNDFDRDQFGRYQSMTEKNWVRERVFGKLGNKNWEMVN